MAADSFHEFVRELFAGLGPVQIKRMFGGAGGYADGVMFLLIAGVTHWVLTNYTHAGLPFLSFLVGFTDIDPFVLSLVQGDFSAPAGVMSRAIIMATASNNLLKALYTVIWGNSRTRALGGGALFALAITTLLVLAVWDV